LIPSDIVLMTRHGEVLHYTYDVHVCARVCEKNIFRETETSMKRNLNI